MAGFSTDFATGRADSEDDKLLTVYSEDLSGNKIPLSSIEAVFTDPDDNSTTYNIGDFDMQNNEYTLYEALDTPGKWGVDVKVTDANGHSERETGTVDVEH